MTPVVTIQLPIRNEYFVVADLLRGVTQLDYPKDRLEIQILDDSDDETVERLILLVREYQETGFDMKLIRRESPQGFKAGALSNATCFARGAFIAIFDADAFPPPDFLKQVLPHFYENQKLGLVQAALKYRNSQASALTRVQSAILDGLMMEQKWLSKRRLPFQFNGSGGIWRRECIEEAGGWSSLTLTEDLDISIRAQLKGWHFLHRSDLFIETELPVSLRAYRNQQFRWIQGSSQVMRLLGLDILQGPVPLLHKAVLFTRLLRRPVLHLFLVCLGIAPFIWMDRDIDSALNVLLGIFAVGALGYLCTIQFMGRAARQNVQVLPVFLILLAGLSPHALLALWGGLCGSRTPFHRTPKAGASAVDFAPLLYRAPFLSSYWVDIAGSVIQASGVVYLLYFDSPALAFMTALFATVYFFVGLGSIVDRCI